LKKRLITGGNIHPWDALVVGAGPAGALAAIELARKGIQVLLVEKRVFPRWKVCGCCLNGQAQAVLEAAGQGELIRRQGGVHLTQLKLGFRRNQATLALPAGRALSRECFDQALVDAAVLAGASFRGSTTALMGPVYSGARTVTLQESGTKQIEQVRAKVVLVAAGLAHRSMPPSEAREVRIKRHSRIGAGCVLQASVQPYPSGTIHMAIGRQGYVGLVQREDGCLNVAAAFDRQALKGNADHCRAAEAARVVLASAGFAIPAGLELARWQVTPALTRQATRLAGERFFVIGDAAGYVEPFTGEGMAWALTAGAAVVPLVLAGIEEWNEAIERRWHRIQRQQIGRRQRTCRAVASLLRQPGATAVAFALSKHLPVLSEQLIAQLNHVVIP
jgi:menaquinone-9 beta-reductase